MAETEGGFMDRHYFLLRRLHSLTGVLPVGVFLFPHLTTNSSIMWGNLGHNNYGYGGVETFQHEVNFIHGLPALLLIEVFGLWLPIAFHALFGIYIGISGRPNVRNYPYDSNWRYTLQRLTGYIGVVFIFMHIASLRWGWSFGGLMPGFDGHHAASTTASHFQDGPIGIFMGLFYLICVLSLVYHFANGLWTSAITWGLTVTAQAQQRWGYVCAMVGVGLGLATIASVIGFATLDVERAHAVELQMLGGHVVDADASLPASPASPDLPDMDTHDGDGH